jgi:hypothetical protein
MKLSTKINSLGCRRAVVYLTLMLSFVLTGHSQTSRRTEQLKAELTIIDSDYCKIEVESFSIPDAKTTSVVTHPLTVGQLRLRLKLLITNTTSQPIIIDKSSFGIIRRTIAEVGINDRGGRVVSNTVFYLSSKPYDLNSPSPDARLFAVIKPKDTYSVEFNDTVPFELKDTEKLIKGASLRYDLETWGGRNAHGESLREKWKQFGYLWIDPISTNKIPIAVKQKK